MAHKFKISSGGKSALTLERLSRGLQGSRLGMTGQGWATLATAGIKSLLPA
jgi:hypothetical protein